MQIISLTAENIKKLKAVKITPDGNVVMITGENDQGKTSVLDCISYGLEGSKKIDKRPIRKGEESAKIALDIGDNDEVEFTVEKTFTEKGSYLTIKNKEGFKATSPQALLNKIVGKISFDPLAFIKEKDAKKQRQILLDLVGVDLTEINADIQKVKAVRTNINQSRTRLKAELEKKPIINAPEKEIDVAKLTKELEKGRKHNQMIANEKASYEKNGMALAARRNLLTALTNDYDKLVSQLADLKSKMDEAEKAEIE